MSSVSNTEHVGLLYPACRSQRLIGSYGVSAAAGLLQKQQPPKRLACFMRLEAWYATAVRFTHSLVLWLLFVQVCRTTLKRSEPDWQYLRVPASVVVKFLRKRTWASIVNDQPTGGRLISTN
jgi:hypothetical protein